MKDHSLGTMIVADGPFSLSDEECRARSDNELMDMIEAWLLEQPEEKYTDPPIIHRFVPHAYSREIFMRKGLIVTSRIHKTQHILVISQGECSVWTQQTGVVRLKAPCTMITQPGTRRLLFMHTDSVWVTLHPTELKNVADIEKEILLPHYELPKLTDEQRDMITQFMAQWHGIVDPDFSPPALPEESSHAPATPAETSI